MQAVFATSVIPPPDRSALTKIGSHLAPEIGHRNGGSPGLHYDRDF